MLLFSNKSFAIHFDPETRLVTTFRPTFQKEAHYVKAISASVHIIETRSFEKWLAILEENTCSSPFCSPWELAFLHEFPDKEDPRVK
jgi:hypothetical protein